MSLHVAVFGKSRIVVCAESASVSPAGVARPDADKLFRVGLHTVCGVVGLTASRGDVRERIAMLISSQDQGLLDSPRNFLNALRDEEHGPLDAFVRERAEDFSSPFVKDYALRVFCVRRKGNKNDLFELMFPIVKMNGVATVGTPAIEAFLDEDIIETPRSYSLGACDCLPAEYAIDPDAPDDVIADGFLSLFRGARARSPYCSQVLGGRLKIVFMEPDGMRQMVSEPL